MRIADYLDTSAARWPDKEALVFGPERVTYGDLQRQAHAVAHALARTLGVDSNAHVAIYSPNNIRVPMLQLGINRADMAWVALHDRNTPDVNAQVGVALDCALVFFHSSHDAEMAPLKALMPGVSHWICIDADSSHGELLDRWLEGCWRPFEYTAADPARLCVLLPTGGTTGPSKGACHTHQSKEFMMVGLVDAWRFDYKTRLLTVAPLSHAAGMLAISIIPKGGTNVVLPGFDADRVLSTIAAERITHLFLPPTALYALMAHPASRVTDLSSLRFLIIGAAPVSPDKFREAVEIFGPVLHEGYGQAECSMPLLSKYPADYLRPDGSFNESVLKSAGRAAAYVRVEIVDDEGRPLPPGNRGEIAIRATQLMLGYYKRPQETAEVQRNGFLLTGDVGISDEAGFITIVDRKKDMIVTGGFNVFPAEVESVIYAHESVLDCIVIGVPDEKWGEAIRALVQLKPEKVATEAELLAHCKDRLGSVKSPKAIEVVQSLPRSAVGKLLRREARAKYWVGHWRSV